MEGEKGYFFTDNVRYLILFIHNEYYLIDLFPFPIVWVLGIFKNKLLKFKARKLSFEQYERYIKNITDNTSKSRKSRHVWIFSIVLILVLIYAFFLIGTLSGFEMMIPRSYIIALVIILYLLLVMLFLTVEKDKYKSMEFGYVISFYLKKELSFKEENRLWFRNIVLAIVSYFHIVVLGRGLVLGYFSLLECLAIFTSVFMMFLFSLVPPSLAQNDVYIEQLKTMTK